MSKFLDTQFSVTGIKNFYAGASYDQYDLVDFQYYTGNAIYPKDLSGLFAWFNLDNLNNLEFDSSGKISAWYNSAPGHSAENLYNFDTSDNTRPKYSQDKNAVVFEANADIGTLNQLYTHPTSPNFSGFLTGDRCWFIVYEFDSLRSGNLTTPQGYYANYATIINTDEKNISTASTGYLGVYGNNSDNIINSNVLAKSQEFVMDSNPANLYPTASSLNSAFSSADLLNKNIISIVKNNTTNNLILRNNGQEILNITTTNFASGCASLRIGTAGNFHGVVPAGAVYNYDASNISINEILGYSALPTNEQITGLEKYLFKKHFLNSDNLYIAKDDFTASSYQYSPINLTGALNLTKDIDFIFNKTYGCSASFSTKAIKANYGDGYYTNVIPNINNIITNFTLSYNGLTDKQANSLIGFFQNSFEYQPLTLTSSYENVEIDLFYPYKDNAKIYFENLDQKCVDSNINNITINCTTAYDSSLDYKGYLVTNEEVIRFFDFAKVYNYNDVVYYKSSSLEGGYYWFTGQNPTLVTSEQSPTGSNSLFTRDFYFKPDLDFSIPVKPRFLKNEYELTSVTFEQDGINKNILDLSLTFNGRSDKEAIAILKFLDAHCGFKLFEFILPEPYNKNITVYCPEWNHTYKFKDNHDISVKFLEFKGKTASDIYFNTLLSL
jgi:phage-related protein